MLGRISRSTGAFAMISKESISRIGTERQNVKKKKKERKEKEKGKKKERNQEHAQRRKEGIFE